MKHLLSGLSIGTVLLISLVGRAQEKVTLNVGDKAPAIKSSKWIKGTPVSSFKEDNHLYVLEFWATWCGPCRAAMPHLTELQKQYEGKISVIGVDIWEDSKRGSTAYDTFIVKVEKFVKENEAAMGYAVMVDNNEQHMGNNWMKAAGRQGIPTTFIVQNNKVIWIGGPSGLDEVLPKMLNGSYSLAAHKKSEEARKEASQKQTENRNAVFKPIEQAIGNKDYKRASELFSKARAENPAFRYELDASEFQMLLSQVGEQEAIAFGNEWQKEEKRAGRVMYNLVMRQTNVAKSTYLWAAKTYEGSAENATGFDFDRMASGYARGGDYKNAIRCQEKAISTAEETLRVIKTGQMTPDIVAKFKQTLENYKKSAKENSLTRIRN